MRMRHTMLQYRVPAIFPIACTCLCQLYPQCSHPIFYPSLHLTSFLPREAPERQPAEDRCQNQTTVTRTRRLLLEPDGHYQNQTTVARTRRPLLEPDDRYQNQTTTATRTTRKSFEQ